MMTLVSTKYLYLTTKCYCHRIISHGLSFATCLEEMHFLWNLAARLVLVQGFDGFDGFDVYQKSISCQYYFFIEKSFKILSA